MLHLFSRQMDGGGDPDPESCQLCQRTHRLIKGFRS